jgi:NADH-quinone oxidoreductase subunit L
LMGLSVGVALGGMLLARWFYLQKPALPEQLMNRFRGLYITLLNKYWVDEIYDTLIVRPVKLISTYVLWKFVDVGVIDGIVNGTARVAQATGGQLKHFQSGYTRAYAGWILFGAVLVVAYLSFS